MANIQVADRCLMTIVGEVLGQRTMSTFCYGLSALTGTATINNALDRLHAAVIVSNGLLDRFVNCIAPQWTKVAIWYQIISPSRYAKVTKTTGATTGNFSSGVFNSSNQAFTILRRGDLGLRSNVSVLHVPMGQTLDEQTNNGLSVDLDEQAQLLAAQMLLPITTTTVVATWDPVINNGPNAGDYTPITVTAVNQDVRTMRRRGVRLGI